MNKNVLIFGGVALVGVVAYLYFKPKAEAKSDTMGASTTGTGTTGTDTTATGTTGTGTAMPPAGTVFTTPEEVEAITVKVSTARDLTQKICDLKKQFKITDDNINDFMNITGVFINDFIPKSLSSSELLKFQVARKKALPTIANSINELKALGYKEVDCKMVRIA